MPKFPLADKNLAQAKPVSVTPIRNASLPAIPSALKHVSSPGEKLKENQAQQTAQNGSAPQNSQGAGNPLVNQVKGKAQNWAMGKAKDKGWNLVKGAFGKKAGGLAEGLGSAAALEGGKLASEGTLKAAGNIAGKAGSEAAKSIPKLVAKEGVEIAAKQGGKLAAKEGLKIGAKGLGKSVLKKIPLLSVGAGIFFSLGRFAKGDVIGGVGELASGVAATVPGAGTAVSFAIDGALAVKDIANANRPSLKLKATDFRTPGTEGLGQQKEKGNQMAMAA